MKIERKFTPSVPVVLLKKEALDPMEMLSKQFTELTDATLDRIAKGEAEMKDVQSCIDDLERKIARKGGGGVLDETWGGQFIREKQMELASMLQAKGQVGLSLKSTVTTAVNSGGAIDVPMRDNTVMLPRQRLTVRSLMNVSQTESGSVEFAKQTTRDNQADMVAEGNDKPESSYEWGLETVQMRTVAHYTKASTQILSDAPAVRDMIDMELRYGLMLKEEQQLLFGANVGQQLNGMATGATAYSATSIANYTPSTTLDTIGVAIQQNTLLDFEPNGIVMNPSDWWLMRLTKDADSRYLLGDPQEVVAPSLFGLPVVVTKSMAAGNFLLGDFRMLGTLYDRWSPRVEVGFENDDFTKNLVTIRGEQRLGLGIKHADALIYGAF